jgi:hypothetical protein
MFFLIPEVLKRDPLPHVGGANLTDCSLPVILGSQQGKIFPHKVIPLAAENQNGCDA